MLASCAESGYVILLGHLTFLIGHRSVCRRCCESQGQRHVHESHCAFPALWATYQPCR